MSRLSNKKINGSESEFLTSDSIRLYPPLAPSNRCSWVKIEHLKIILDLATWVPHTSH